MPSFERRPAQAREDGARGTGSEVAHPGWSMTTDRARMAQEMVGAAGDRQQEADLSVWGSAMSGETWVASDTEPGAVLQLEGICARIGQDDATGARAGAAQFAAERRSRLGIEDDDLTRAAGRVWSAADQIVRAMGALDASDATGAKELAHQAAETLRGLLGGGLLAEYAVEPAIARAGQLWTRAEAIPSQPQETHGQAHGGNALWTTACAIWRKSPSRSTTPVQETSTFR